jgi:hypothetical protein
MVVKGCTYEHLFCFCGKNDSVYIQYVQCNFMNGRLVHICKVQIFPDWVKGTVKQDFICLKVNSIGIDLAQF